MFGNIVLGVLILMEIGVTLLSKGDGVSGKGSTFFVRVGVFICFITLMLTPIMDWSLRWYALALLLGMQAILAGHVLVRKKERPAPKLSRKILASCGRVLLLSVAVLPAILFPLNASIEPTGEFGIGTSISTLTDESRAEFFTEKDDKRRVTIQFWYPTRSDGAALDGKFPLVIFSHGAFGYRRSNYSTYLELASHGYVVCSIDHTYHAFLTKEEDGKSVIANMDFMNSAMKAQNGGFGVERTYELAQDWMTLRTGDMSFVLDYIRNMVASNGASGVFRNIDLERIGALGHSLGGATAAQIGRDEPDVDAVIVIDGTMLGEVVGLQDGKELFRDEPYPKAIMNLYGELHYEQASTNDAEYANMVADERALQSYQVVMEKAGHLNFTDLPIVAPALARLLGTGDIDARYCIETTNELILQFFDNFLKMSDVEIPRLRVL